MRRTRTIGVALTVAALALSGAAGPVAAKRHTKGKPTTSEKRHTKDAKRHTKRHT